MNAETESNTSAWTLSRLLSWTTDYLTRQGVEDARLATEVLLSKAAGCRRIDLYARFDQVLAEEALARFRGWVRQAAAGEPIAYLVGEKEFFSLAFHVTHDVLIPRPETELLVERAIDHWNARGLRDASFLDLGTGSGCIAVTLLKHLREARAVATDISPGALAVAARNAARHGVADRLTFLEADRLAIPAEAVPVGGFAMLVSNPPYIAADAVPGLHATIRDFEPRCALTDGADGLAFYRAIAKDGPALLSDDGVMFVEVGDGQAAAVIETLQAGTGLLHRRTWKDQVVGQPRALMFGRAGECAPDRTTREREG